jgi:hypothetical protein
MQNRPSTNDGNPSMEYIAALIEVCFQADGVFGLDRHHNG